MRADGKPGAGYRRPQYLLDTGRWPRQAGHSDAVALRCLARSVVPLTSAWIFCEIALNEKAADRMLRQIQRRLRHKKFNAFAFKAFYVGKGGQQYGDKG